MKKSRKILSGIMALSLMCGMVSVPSAFAEYEEKYVDTTGPLDILEDPEITESEDEPIEEDDTVKVEKSGKWGKSGTWTLDSKGLLTINGEKTFSGLDDQLTKDEIETVKGLVIGDGITDIASFAFSSYNKLGYVTFPDTLTSTGNNAFYRCEALYDVELPESLTALGADSFRECKKLTSIVIPDSVTSIGDFAFMVSGLVNLTIGRNVVSIGERAFDNTSIGKAQYRGTEKEWKAVTKKYSATPFDIECIVKTGDANSDGGVNISDAVFIMQCLSNPNEYSMNEMQQLNADVVDVGSGLTPIDALAIQMIGINLINLEDLPATSEDVNSVAG